MQLTTSNESCVEIARLLHAHGVRHVVVSPGSRNAPLSVAVSRIGCFDVDVVIDERTAGFVALGMASVAAQPVAVMCTSGTALLNIAPAVAEAYYRRVPLIVISADRPAEWIDQDDSQTLRQFRALDNIVKVSYNLPAFVGTPNLRWLMNRTINDAFVMATGSPAGPVHLNVQIDEPLDSLSPAPVLPPRVIRTVFAGNGLSGDEARKLAEIIADSRGVLVIAGFNSPSPELDSLLGQLAFLPNVAVMTEAQSNIHLPDGANIVAAIDATLSAMTDDERISMLPDKVITFGGSLLSRMVKQWLRGGADAGVVEHWHVGVSENAVDCFRCLTRRVVMEPEAFFSGLVQFVPYKAASDGYGRRWKQFARFAAEAKDAFCSSAQWSDLKAMHLIMNVLPDHTNLQLSNGTVVRYAQLFPYGHLHRIDCNRGVSGIDGCTSTAVGASKVYPALTVLVTGDMSAQYDMGALALPDIPSRFRMIVLNNGGGGIFRFIKSTSSLDELERFFVGNVRLPLSALSEGFGFRYFEVTDEDSFNNCIADFLDESATAPAIMNIITPGIISADILRSYFKIRYHNQ